MLDCLNFVSSKIFLDLIKVNLIVGKCKKKKSTAFNHRTRVKRSFIMTAVGVAGHKRFDSMKELAKEYPHKWSSSVLYRDYLRTIHRKYDEPQRSKYVGHVRNAFRQYGYINDEMRMKLMGRYYICIN